MRHKEVFGNKSLLEAWGQYAVKAYFPSLTSNEKILEVGAGTGINVSKLKDLAKVEVVEPSQIARDHCLEIGIEAYEKIENLPEPARYDRILLRHVLEYVQNPRDFILNLSGHLKENGHIIIILPCENTYKSIDENEMDYHLYCWNQQTIHNLIMDCLLIPTNANLHYFNGRRLMYPLLRFIGMGAYSRVIYILGRLTNSSEIVIHASLKKN